MPRLLAWSFARPKRLYAKRANPQWLQRLRSPPLPALLASESDHGRTAACSPCFGLCRTWQLVWAQEQDVLEGLDKGQGSACHLVPMLLPALWQAMDWRTGHWYLLCATTISVGSGQNESRVARCMVKMRRPLVDGVILQAHSVQLSNSIG